MLPSVVRTVKYRKQPFSQIARVASANVVKAQPGLTRYARARVVV